MSRILRITDPIPSDDSIDKYEHIEYELVRGTNLNNSGGYTCIKIIIKTQDIFTHPSESFLLIEGRSTKANGTAYADADNISLTNNALIHLFKNIWYKLSGHEIKKIMYPGQATTMLGLLKYLDDFSKYKGLIQLWYKDITIQPKAQNVGWNVRKLYIINNSDPKGTFSF